MDSSSLRLAIALRQHAQSRRAGEFSADALLFGPQKRAQQCRLKRKIKVCGRRSGKTFEDAVDLLESALTLPAVPVLYVTLTRINAKEIIWPTLVALNREYSLGFKVREQSLELISPVGVAIQLRGAHTAQEIEKYRGKFFKKIKLDEPGSFPDRVIRPLVRDVLRPTLTDYDGEMSMGGTPPPLRRGYFFEEWQKLAKRAAEQGCNPEELGLFHWTVRENERFPARLAGKNIDQILADIREEFGWTEDDPTYRREYLGEDVEDPNALLFEYSDARNHYEAKPEGAWHYVLALDLGHDDNSALAVLGWPENQRRVYLVDEWRDNKVDVTDCAEKLIEFRSRYRPQAMVIDQGGLGKMIAEEMRRRHGLPVKPADKAQKPAHIKLLNTALRKGELLAKRDSFFAEECGLVRKDPEGLAEGKLQELSAKKGGYHGNMTDAVLYGWRECKAFFEEIPEDRPPEYRPPSALMLEIIAQQRRDKRRDPLGSMLGFDE